MRKSILMMLSLALVLSIASVASAQHGSDFEFCGDLSEEDCDLYYSFFEAHTPLSSGAFNMVVDGAVTADGATFDATVNVDGAFVYNLDEYNAFLDSIADLTLLDVSVDTMLTWFEAGIDAFDAELSVVVTPPAVFAFMLPVETVDVNLWMVDGVGYVDLTPIGLLAEDESLSGVYGVDALQAIRDGLSMVTIGQMLEGMEDDDMGGGDFNFDDFNFEDNEGFRQFQNQMEAQENFQDEDVISEFVTFTRLEDSEVDGVAVAVFQTEVDLVALFETEAVLESIAGSMPPEAEGEVDVDQIAAALAEGMAGSSFVITESYGLEDGVMYASTADITVIVDPAPFMALDGASEEAMAEEEPVEVVVSIDVTRSDINAVEEITVPDGATVLTTEDLMALDN